MDIGDPRAPAPDPVGTLRAPNCGISNDLQGNTMPADGPRRPRPALRGVPALDPACYLPRMVHCTQLHLRFFRIIPASYLPSVRFLPMPALAFSLIYTSSLCLAALKRQTQSSTSRQPIHWTPELRDRQDSIPSPTDGKVLSAV